MSGRGAIGGRTGLFGFLKRRALLVVVCAIACGVAAGVFASGGDKTYRGDAHLLVPTGQQSEPGGSAYDAQRLAQTYAVLLTEDSTFLQAVSTRSSIPVNDVKQGLTAAVVANSSVIRVNWIGDSSAQVTSFFRALDDALGSQQQVTAALPVGAIDIINLPDRVVEQNNVNTLAIPLGLILGLCLGVAGAVMLERSSPRIDSVDDATTLLGLPTADISRLSSAGVSAVAAEMQAGSKAKQIRAAVVALPSIDAAVIDDVATRLEAVVGLPLDIGGDRNSESHVIAIRGGRLDGSGDAERMSQTADANVLIFQFGCRASEIISAVERISQFGHTPNWLLGVSSKRNLSRVAKSKEVTEAIELRDSTPAPV